MQSVKRSSLFTDLSSQESATVSGAGFYYYSPVYYCYPSSSGSSSSGWSGGSVNQTVNVNVRIED